MSRPRLRALTLNVTLCLAPEEKARLEQAAALLGVRAGRRLSLGQAVLLLLEESPLLLDLRARLGGVAPPAPASEASEASEEENEKKEESVD